MKNFIFLISLILITISCDNGNKSSTTENPPKSIDLAAEALRLSKEFIIVDGHVDLPYRLKKKMEDVSVIS